MFRIEVDNTRGRIVDPLNIDQLSVLSNICSFKVENAEYRQAMIRQKSHGRAQYDGYKRLFNMQNQTFPIGLYGKIINFFMTLGIPYTVDDYRVHMDRTLDYMCTAKQYRQYQQDVTMQSILNGSGIIKSATGSGKTTMGCMIIAALGKPTAFVVHTKDLLYQTKSEFERLLGVKIGQIGDGVVDIQPVTVATVQTLAQVSDIEYESYRYDEDSEPMDNTELDSSNRTMIRRWIPTVGTVFFDEVQRIASKTAYNARFLFANADNTYGMSASPWRDDGADLMIEAAFGPMICNITASQLIDEGYLVQPNIMVRRVHSNVWSGKDYSAIYKSAIVENSFRNMQVIQEAIHQYDSGRCTLVLVTQIKHGETLEYMIRLAGRPAQFISGKSKSKDRKQVIEDMRNGKAPMVIASTIADVGLDVPRINAMVEAGAGKSSTTALQRVGRCVRQFTGKTDANYITFRDTAPYLNQQIDKKLEIWRTERRFNIMEE